MKIRPVNRGDRDEWARMRERLYPNVNPREIDDWFDPTGNDGTHVVGVAVFVADSGDGTLAGFVEIGFRDYAEGCATTPVAYLESWYVDQDVRRTGLGRRLVNAAEVWAKARGFSEMASDTDLAHENSLQAHLAIGYEEVERKICLIRRLR